MALAREALASGDVLRALSLVESADGADLDARGHADMLRVRAQLALLGVTPAGLGAFEELAAQAESLAAQEPVAAAMTLADTAMLALYRNRGDLALAMLARAGELAGDDLPARRYLSGVAGIAHTFRGELEAAAAVLERDVDPFGDAASVVESVQLLQSAVVALASVERYDAAVAIAQRGVTAARGVGATGVLPLLLCLLANSAYFTGDYDTVVFAAGEAQRLARGTGQVAMQVFAGACLALAYAVRGDAAEVERHVSLCRRLLPESGMAALAMTNLVAEGLLALGACDWPRADALYSELEAALGAQGRRTGVLQWQGDWIEALVRVGRRDDAERALAQFHDTIGDLPLPWSRAIAARSHGVLAAAGWREHLTEAITAHHPAHSPLELGRTHLWWAERAAAEGAVDEVREHAEQARQLFAQVAARPWLLRAEELLAARGPAPDAKGPAPARVSVHAFGPLGVAIDNVEQLVPLDGPGRLLRYLVAAGESVAVDAAVEALWPDAAAGVGATRLRNVLSRVRRRWGDLVVRDGPMLRWGAGVEVDVLVFAREADRALATGDLALARRAVERYRGEPLPGVRHEDWTVALRTRQRSRYLRLLTMLADDAASRRDPDTAVAFLEQAQSVDPYEEAHCLRAAAVLADAGRPGAARRFLAKARQIADELGVGTSEEFRRIEAKVLRSG